MLSLPMIAYGQIYLYFIYRRKPRQASQKPAGQASSRQP
jgi:hypothetical protein